MTESQIKRAERKEKFRKLGAALSAMALTPNEIAWRDRLGDHQFDFYPTAVQGADCPTRIVNGKEVEIYAGEQYSTSRAAGGPAIKTVQYHRTVRRSR